MNSVPTTRASVRSITTVSSLPFSNASRGPLHSFLCDGCGAEGDNVLCQCGRVLCQSCKGDRERELGGGAAGMDAGGGGAPSSSVAKPSTSPSSSYCTAACSHCGLRGGSSMSSGSSYVKCNVCSARRLKQFAECYCCKKREEDEERQRQRCGSSCSSIDDEEGTQGSIRPNRRANAVPPAGGRQGIISYGGRGDSPSTPAASTTATTMTTTTTTTTTTMTATTTTSLSVGAGATASFCVSDVRGSEFDSMSDRPWLSYNITQELYDKMAAIFVKFDAAGDGRLSREGVHNLFVHLNFSTTDKTQTDVYFACMDRGVKGYVTLDDVCAWLGKNPPDLDRLAGFELSEYIDMVLLYRGVDRDNDGYIGKSEFSEMFRKQSRVFITSLTRMKMIETSWDCSSGSVDKAWNACRGEEESVSLRSFFDFLRKQFF